MELSLFERYHKKHLQGGITGMGKESGIKEYEQCILEVHQGWKNY